MTKNDNEMLEDVTEVFTKALIRNKFEHQSSYAVLAKRLAELIDAEIVWRPKLDNDKTMMSFWGPAIN